jgi:hypothetical protein
MKLSTSMPSSISRIVISGTHAPERKEYRQFAVLRCVSGICHHGRKKAINVVGQADIIPSQVVLKFERGSEQ